jgi:hypothetical protein
VEDEGEGESKIWERSYRSLKSNERKSDPLCSDFVYPASLCASLASPISWICDTSPSPSAPRSLQSLSPSSPPVSQFFQSLSFSSPSVPPILQSLQSPSPFSPNNVCDRFISIIWYYVCWFRILTLFANNLLDKSRALD